MTEHDEDECENHGNECYTEIKHYRIDWNNDRIIATVQDYCTECEKEYDEPYTKTYQLVEE